MFQTSLGKKNHQTLINRRAKAVIVAGPLGAKHYTSLIYVCLKASLYHLSKRLHHIKNQNDHLPKSTFSEQSRRRREHVK